MADDLHLNCKLLTISVSLSLFIVGHGHYADPELCGAPNIDVSNLTSKIWRFSLPKAFCLNPKTSNMTVGGCEVTMAFCQSVSASGACSNSSVCESFTTISDTYNLATYVPGSNPFHINTLPSNEIGFRTSYESGEQYMLPNRTVCTLHTVMTFICNKTAPWMTDSTAKILTVPNIRHIQFSPGAKLCTYNFTFDFAGACPKTTPQTQDQLSPGSLILMVFVVFVILYFVMGCFINIVRGKVGDEMIPHHRFWAVLPIYIMDGIMFTVTCGGTKYVQPYHSI